jgi:uncharacterized Zn finger protein
MVQDMAMRVWAREGSLKELTLGNSQLMEKISGTEKTHYSTSTGIIKILMPYTGRPD